MARRAPLVRPALAHSSSAVAICERLSPDRHDASVGEAREPESSCASSRPMEVFSLGECGSGRGHPTADWWSEAGVYVNMIAVRWSSSIDNSNSYK